MKCGAREEAASYVLEWSLESASDAVEGERGLTLRYSMRAFEELFISDRLWDYDKAKKRIPDPFGVYRFVGGDSLRLVFAQAPYPPNVMPHVIYPPLYSRIDAGETRQVEMPIALPVDEYSSLARNIASPTALEKVSKVHFVLGIRRRSDMDADPAPPPNETAEAAGYIVHDPKLIVSSCEVTGGGIPVKRRTGYIARFPLRGEPPPEPMPPP